jgi:N-acetyl-anhydromuramyl-L-alanine amidase AmpD
MSKITLKDLQIKSFRLPKHQYIPSKYDKVQIYLHHTAGSSSARGVMEYWAKTKERIATCVAIAGKGAAEGDGKIVQGFSSKYWGYHLGLKTTVFKSRKLPVKSLDRISIGIEICNFGYLTKTKDGRFLTYVGSEIPKEDVIELDKPYKGHKYWHNYTEAQIESVRKLLLFWHDTYGIPLEYNEDVWEVTDRALKAEPGVFTHNSVRADKTDVYPHPGLIKMWKSLTGAADTSEATTDKQQSETKVTSDAPASEETPTTAANKATEATTDTNPQTE